MSEKLGVSFYSAIELDNFDSDKVLEGFIKGVLDKIMKHTGLNLDKAPIPICKIPEDKNGVMSVERMKEMPGGFSLHYDDRIGYFESVIREASYYLLSAVNANIEPASDLNVRDTPDLAYKYSKIVDVIGNFEKSFAIFESPEDCDERLDGAYKKIAFDAKGRKFVFKDNQGNITKKSISDINEFNDTEINTIRYSLAALKVLSSKTSVDN